MNEIINFYKSTIINKNKEWALAMHVEALTFEEPI